MLYGILGLSLSTSHEKTMGFKSMIGHESVTRLRNICKFEQYREICYITVNEEIKGYRLWLIALSYLLFGETVKR